MNIVAMFLLIMPDANITTIRRTPCFSIPRIMCRVPSEITVERSPAQCTQDGLMSSNRLLHCCTIQHVATDNVKPRLVARDRARAARKCRHIVSLRQRQGNHAASCMSSRTETKTIIFIIPTSR